MLKVNSGKKILTEKCFYKGENKSMCNHLLKK